MNNLIGGLNTFAAVVAILTFIWQFAVIGRKSIGYRTQMDTPVTGEAPTIMSASGASPAAIPLGEQFPDLKVLAQLVPKPEPGETALELEDISIVLMRIENSGITSIDEGDYATPQNQKAGLHLRFPGRRVIGMAVTEVSSAGVKDSLESDSGLGPGEATEQNGAIGIIDLPKVKMNRSDHYKVLAVLARAGSRDWPYVRRRDPVPRWLRWVPGIDWLYARLQRPLGESGPYYPPELSGALLRGTVRHTYSRSPSRAAIIMITALVVLALGEFYVLSNQNIPRLDCEAGHLAVVGSTAFGPVVSDAASSYMKLCPGANISAGFTSTQQGLQTLNDEGERGGERPVSDTLALADGDQLSRGLPELVARPIALGLFAVVVNDKAGVANLDTDQIRDLFSGKITNWNQIGGHDLTVHLVGRNSDSGSRATFEQRFLPATGERQDNSHDCRTSERAGDTSTTLCLRASTADLLDEVAGIDGAVGYAELGMSLARTGLTAVNIDNFPPSTDIAVHQGYPFWQTEFAYTFKDPGADSLAAGFLRYLTNQTGADIIRSHRDLPCSALPNPVLCQPAR
ncbi:PstS family phosphate ABC transporter substrate-binding protein [Nocardia alni]|uniref:PstS family phosphate ABC transporter substrate-binding protein n=1 Tax=Nocardia alni TaxID=2815723 RepID=UPI001C2391D9|nr:substrate-binding domain-containing protein [Nocardia alni]